MSRRRYEDDDDEDDDDRPRRRRRDDDDDDRPRRRRRKSGGASPVVIGLVIGAAVLLPLLCIGGGLLLGLVLPAVQKVSQVAGGRVNDQNNLKELSLAAHHQMDRTGQFRGPDGQDDRGNPLPGLSWRVGLLPHLPDGPPLWAKLDKSKAWDHAANKPLLDTPPKAVVTRLGPSDTLTPYRAFVGGGALFDTDSRPVRPRDITDGMSSTILYLHAAERVPWTQPRDIPFGPGVPLPPLTAPGLTGGTHVAMADGSVRFLKSSTPEAVVRMLVTRAGGEVVPDW